MVHGVGDLELRERLEVCISDFFREVDDNSLLERKNLFKHLTYFATAADAF